MAKAKRIAAWAVALALSASMVPAAFAEETVPVEVMPDTAPVSDGAAVEVQDVQQMQVQPAPAAQGENAPAAEAPEEQLRKAIEAAAPGTTVQIPDSFALSGTLTITKPVTLDLNGKTVTASGFHAIEVQAGGELTIVDSTVSGQPQVSADKKTVTYASGAIAASGRYDAVICQGGGRLMMRSGTLKSENYSPVDVYGQRDPAQWSAPIASSAVIEGGYLEGPEGAVGVWGNGASAVISGGVLVATDNAVVAGNGSVTSSVNNGGTSITISGGQLIGHIKTPGYIACGIYHPQYGTVTMTGGEIYADGGAGIVMRNGTLNMTGGTVTASGTGTGWVGDSKYELSSGAALEVQYAAGGYEGNNAQAGESRFAQVAQDAVLNGDVKVENDFENPQAETAGSLAITGGSVNGTVELVQGSAGSLEVTGGSFAGDVRAYVPATHGEAKALGADLPYEVKSVDELERQAEAQTTGADGTALYYMDIEDALKEAGQGDTVRVVNDAAIEQDAAVPSGVTVVVPADKTLTVAGRLTNNGTVNNEGEILLTPDAVLDGSNPVVGSGDVIRQDIWPTEGLEGFVTRLYRIVLGRDPEQAGYDDWCNRLRTQQETARQVVGGFIYSREFESKNVPDAEFVAILYRTLLNREPEQLGFDYWMNKLAAGAGRDAVFEGVANSQEFDSIKTYYAVR